MQPQADIVGRNRLVQNHANSLFWRPRGNVQIWVLCRVVCKRSNLSRRKYEIIGLVVCDIFASSKSPIFSTRNSSNNFTENDCRGTGSSTWINSLKRIKIHFILEHLSLLWLAKKKLQLAKLRENYEFHPLLMVILPLFKWFLNRFGPEGCEIRWYGVTKSDIHMFLHPFIATAFITLQEMLSVSVGKINLISFLWTLRLKPRFRTRRKAPVFRDQMVTQLIHGRNYCSLPPMGDDAI